MSAGDENRAIARPDGREKGRTTRTPYRGEPKGAYRPKEFQTRYCVGHTKLYQEIAAGRLIARKVGSATVILHDDAESWARALPTVAPTGAIA